MPQFSSTHEVAVAFNNDQITSEQYRELMDEFANARLQGRDPGPIATEKESRQKSAPSDTHEFETTLDVSRAFNDGVIDAATYRREFDRLAGVDAPQPGGALLPRFREDYGEAVERRKAEEEAERLEQVSRRNSLFAELQDIAAGQLSITDSSFASEYETARLYNAGEIDAQTYFAVTSAYKAARNRGMI
ncbi:MAG: hypothetical protein R3C39_00210 [Dehalococcoidia bacterium]